MHSKNICLIVISYERQNEHRGVFILPKVKSILFRYNMLWSILYWKLGWKLFVVTTRGNIEIFFQSKFPFAKSLPKYFWEVGELPDDSSNTKYISVAVSLSNTITLFFIRWWSSTTYFFSTCYSLSFNFCFQISGIAWITCIHWKYNLLCKWYLFFNVSQLLKLQFSFTKSLTKFIFLFKKLVKLAKELSAITNLLNHKYWDRMHDGVSALVEKYIFSSYRRCLGKRMENH